MARSVNWETFLTSAAGRTCVAWEESACARFLAGKLGERAMQVNFSALDPFNKSPIVLRFLANEALRVLPEGDLRLQVLSHPAALPFADESCDVIVLSHTFDKYPETFRQCLDEAVRVLAPNGILLTTFFNSIGSWKLREKVLRTSKILPDGSARLSVNTVKTALTTAGLKLEGGNFGVYAVNYDPKPNPDSRLATWIDKAGDRWWPTLSNVVLLCARKTCVKAGLVGKVNFATARQGRTASAAYHKNALDESSV